MAFVPPLCVYCGATDRITNDHVPPKSFFPRPRPNNLRTVPACFACNNTASKDEEYFLAALMFSDAGVTASGKRLWHEKLQRMYTKNLGLRKVIGQAFEPVRLTTPAGIYLGKRLGLRINEPRLEAVVVKIVRGLHYLETGSTAPLDWDVLCLFARDRRHFESVSQFNHMLSPGTYAWPDVFLYRRGAVPGEPLKSMWLLWFWRTHIFWVTTYDARSELH
jgi:hypothetical protein